MEIRQVILVFNYIVNIFTVLFLIFIPLFFQELMEFDKNASVELAGFTQDALLDWETRKSNALLDLRKRQLQELAKHAQVY